MDTWLIAVGSGILLLAIEYLVFRRGRQSQAWPDAINKAVQEFRRMHVGGEVRVAGTAVDGKQALVDLEIWYGTQSQRSRLTVDKAGAIKGIQPL